MEYNDAKKLFGEATPEKPVFVHMACYDRFDQDRGTDEKPWADFDSAVIGFLADPSGVSCVRLAVIDEGQSLDTVSDFMDHPIFGDYFAIEPELLTVSDVRRPERMNDLYESFKELHAEGGYLVYGTLYAETPSVKDNFLYYQPIEGSATVWNLESEFLRDGTKVSSCDDAFKWVLENHPAYLEGVTIMQNCPSGDWLRMAVPCNFVGYPDGSYETYQNRLNYAQDAADELNVQLGSERAEDVLKAMREEEEAKRQQEEEKKKEDQKKEEQKKAEQASTESVQQTEDVQPAVPSSNEQKENNKQPGKRQLPDTPSGRTATGGEEYQMT